MEGWRLGRSSEVGKGGRVEGWRGWKKDSSRRMGWKEGGYGRRGMEEGVYMKELRRKILGEQMVG
jgi:hypothetical protein